ncbi:hypothetical protein ES332_D05G088900v1 [Gossypium tomentosum]|uniref:glucan endo-1,3-beta-D-glucosidase n=1 Tax=Gossypium tomentosum TaxID=34277 RepID=A0A5D2KS46_GOSTO|nr:hypothetical protein ES332_D05G088900v1 [Gossypium tomentosum]TYH69991.1 hypothetical protein ES332_D05G088900v1 [Gossypium tomentosum]TYH69992.1 hypothetical protein ES332_D05G088900v1 [Gossypium tomentosum]
MAASSSLLFTLLLVLLTFSDSSVQTLGLEVGINYGQIANKLPSPARVSYLLRSLNISRVKLYDADPNVLLAFANTNVEFIIGLGNEYLQNMTDPIKAQNWIQQRVQPYLTRTKITCITVGNEVYKTYDHQLWSNLLPAMQTVYNTLVNLGLDKQVTVTTAHSLDILSVSFPPSAGAFRQDLGEYLHGFELSCSGQVAILDQCVSVFAYKDKPNGTMDPNTNLKYDNAVAQIDAVYSAIKAMGHTDIEVRISETGWPSRGDENEVGATPENAGLYNGNLLRRIEEKQGTPAKPNVPIDIYVFAFQ